MYTSDDIYKQLGFCQETIKKAYILFKMDPVKGHDKKGYLFRDPVLQGFYFA